MTPMRRPTPLRSTVLLALAALAACGDRRDPIVPSGTRAARSAQPPAGRAELPDADIAEQVARRVEIDRRRRLAQLQFARSAQAMQALRSLQAKNLLAAQRFWQGLGGSNGGTPEAGSMDNYWSSRFGAGNSNADNSQGYVHIPGTGSVPYGF